jgi:voltage-gated potassium channel
MDSKKRIYLSVFLFIAVFLVGAVGFKFFGGTGWTLLDSIYMTAITISTIGYEEVVDISANPAARIFTICFIILSLGTIAFAVSSITAFIVEGQLKDILGRRKMEKEIAKLKNHYIVCGSDEIAQTIIQEMILTHRAFVVIEPSKEKIDKLASLGSFLYILGDPSEDDILLKAGLDRAKGILLSLPTDEGNLFVTVTIRSLNPHITIVAKGSDVKAENKIKKAGADYVVSPAFIGGMRMVSQIVRPAVVTFLDTMLRDREQVLRFEEVPVGKGSPLAGKTIAEAKIGERTGALIVAVRRGEAEDYEFNPPSEQKIQDNDVLVLIAKPEMVRSVEKVVQEG